MATTSPPSNKSSGATSAGVPTLRTAAHRPDTPAHTEPSQTEERNIRAVVELEQETRSRRSSLERLTDHVSAAAASTTFVLLHIGWFTLWIAMNSVGSYSFDPYPFNLLTLAVSLEAIILTSFVLMSQDRLTQQADKRAHLDLQVNLLAEQELTAILRVVCLVADEVGIDVAKCEPRIDQLRRQTNVQRLAAELDHELATVEGAKPQAAT